jgi:hypothetical protein
MLIIYNLTIITEAPKLMKWTKLVITLIPVGIGLRVGFLLNVGAGKDVLAVV